MSSTPAIFESLKLPSYTLLKASTSRPRVVKYSRSFSVRSAAEAVAAASTVAVSSIRRSIVLPSWFGAHAAIAIDEFLLSREFRNRIRDRRARFFQELGQL